MIDTPQYIDQRPAHACLTCPAPKNNVWWPAHPGYRTCDDCLTKLRGQLVEIASRYAILDPRPGVNVEEGSRGAPGFGSRSPGSEHIIAMRDRRSSLIARVWVGRDGRVHQESERPPLSVHGVLDTIAWDVAEQREMTVPDRLDVAGLTRFIDVHLDWITRQEMVVEVWEDLRQLVSQLRPATGEPRRKQIGSCPAVLTEGEVERACGTRLYAPPTGDEIRCGSCNRRWPREEWLRLGAQLRDAS